MIVESPVFSNSSTIPKKYTCKGQNINPPLVIKDIPDDTEALAIVLDDPDAPAGIFTHWLIWNIEVSQTRIPESAKFKGAVEGKNSSGSVGYTGPCPPSGTHRYFFKVYALSEKLGLNSQTSIERVKEELDAKKVDEAVLIGSFSSKNLLY